MNPEGSNSQIPPDADSGQPIRLLLEQERETAPDFLNRVRRRIYRRTTASQLASYSWHLPKVVLLEMLGLLRHLMGTVARNEESQR